MHPGFLPDLAEYPHSHDRKFFDFRTSDESSNFGDFSVSRRPARLTPSQMAQAAFLK